MDTFKRYAIYIAVFAVVYFGIRQILPFDLGSYDVKGLTGFIIILACVIAGSFGRSYIAGFLGGMAGDKIDIPAPALYVVEQMSFWLTYAFSAYVASLIAPSVVIVPSLLGLALTFGLLGLAIGVADLVGARFGVGGYARRSRN